MTESAGQVSIGNEMKDIHAQMVTKSSAANAERVKRKVGVPLTKSARVKHNVPCS